MMRIFLAVLFCIIFLSGCNKTEINQNNQDFIGVVDLYKLRNSKTYQESERKLEELKKDVEQKLKENKGQNLEYFLKYNFDEKKEKIMKEYNEKVMKAIYYTANKEKIGLVVSKSVLIYGGLDLTEKVIENLDKGNFDNLPLYNNVQIIAYTKQKNIPQEIVKQIYEEKKIYIVLDKKDVLLGGFDLDELLQKQQKDKDKPNPHK